MTGRNRLMKRLLRTSAIVAIGTGSFATTGLAQDQDQDTADEDAVVEEIIVTGSRIRRDGFSSSAPMDIVLAEEAVVEGIPDIAGLLQSTTIAAGSPQVTAATSSAFVQNGGAGAQTLSLRGLGANRTLVMLNGRRAGPAGVRGGVSSFDLNVIPLAAIQRVEILKDGASSLYGSDAVAGVVNIITKRGDGGSVDVFYTQPFDDGGERLRVSASYGKEFDRGYFRVTADYDKQEELARGDRDYFRCGEAFVTDSITGQRADVIDPRTGEFQCRNLLWGHVWVYDYGATNIPTSPFTGRQANLMQFDFDGLLAANGLPPLGPAVTSSDLVAPAGWFPVNYDRLSAGLADYDHPFQDQSTLIPEVEKFTVMGEGEFEITDDITLYAEFLFNRRYTYINGHRQYWSYIYNSRSDFFPENPLNAGWEGNQWLSPTPITDWADDSVTVKYLRLVGGAKGELNNGFYWDVSYQYSRSDGDYWSQQIFNDSVESNNWRSGSCVGEVTAVRGVPCLDVNWVSPELMRGNPTQAERDFLFGEETGNTLYTQWAVDGFLTGDFMTLPAGEVGFAIGFHFRRDEINDTPGEITLASNAWGNTGAGITAGSDRTKALFAEVIIPLLADKPLIQSFEISASGRWTDVRSFGDGWTYKVGINWEINDQIRVRASRGTSFRTPALFELFLADQTSFARQRIVDPCLGWGAALAANLISQRIASNCAAEGIPPNLATAISATVVTGGGFGVLEAETSLSQNIGIIWTPDEANLSISVDYFEIEVNDEVTQFGAANITFGCYDSEFFPNDPLCAQFDRNPGSGALPFQLQTIRDSFINIATQKNRGLDLALVYRTELPWGNLTVNTQHTFQFEDTQGLSVDTVVDFNGRAGDPKWVGNLNLTLDHGPWSFFWGMDFIGKADNFDNFGATTTTFFGQTVDVDLETEFTMYHNVSVSRELPSGIMVRLGIGNLFDQAPPRVTTFLGEVAVRGNSAFYSQYDWIGRRVFLNATKTF